MQRDMRRPKILTFCIAVACSRSAEHRGNDSTTYEITQVWQSTHNNLPCCLITESAVQLRNGQLVTVPASLIRRLKSHFYTLPPPCGPQGVDVILGVNGYIWVCLGSGDKTAEDNANSDGFENELVYSDKNDVSIMTTFCFPDHSRTL